MKNNSFYLGVLLRRKFIIPKGSKGLVITELPNSTPGVVHISKSNTKFYNYSKITWIRINSISV